MTSLAAIRAQLQPIPLPTTSFEGQTVIVTGSNTGLGLEASQHFVRLNAARVILAVRSVSKGKDAKSLIEAATGRNDVVEVWKLDMSDYDSIKSFATRCSSLDRLDVAVANAGILRNTYAESKGIEITTKVNVIGTFLLIVSLLPIVRRSKEVTGHTSRIVVTSSVLHEEAKFRERHEPSIFEALNKDDKSYLADRYSTSKLLEVLLVRSIAAAMEKGPHAAVPVILNTVNPGLCNSQIDRDAKGVAKYVLTGAKALMARTTEVGGRTLVHSAGAGQDSHGQYMTECRVREPSAFVRSKEGAETQERVHRELMGILENIQPGVTSNI